MANDDRNRESTRNSGRSGRENESSQNPDVSPRSGGIEPGQSETGSSRASRRGESELDERGRSGGEGGSSRGSNPTSGEEENEDVEQPGEE
jgi:hypothetical protein